MREVVEDEMGEVISMSDDFPRMVDEARRNGVI